MRLILALAASIAATGAHAQDFFGVERVPNYPPETHREIIHDYVRPNARIIPYDNSGWQPGSVIPCADQGFQLPTVGQPGPTIGRNPNCANRVENAWRLSR